jgi:hypothetical protein
MAAPAYRAFRLGLVVLGVGSVLFGVAAGRDGALPVWSSLPFALGALCGLISFSRDLGQFGTVLWILFGLGWVWLGLALLLEGVARFWQKRRATHPHGRGAPPGPKPL